MSPALVFIEARDGTVTPGSLGLLARARSLGGAAAVVCGPDAAGVASTLGRFGAEVAWYCDDPAMDPDLAGPQVDVLAALVREHDYGTVLFENSIVAADVAAGLAARLDAGVNWDLQDLSERDGTLVGTRLALDDTLSIEVEWVAGVRLAVFRLGLHEPVEQAAAGDVRRQEPDIAAHARATQVLERTAAADADEARISSADTLIAGGRGLRDREALSLLEELAEAVGGAVVVTLPLVDRGWYPHTRQVGQTGQKVRPRLYIACGVSGALAHRVGMERSGAIVAINSDETAPIFGICDVGVVGDLHEIVPELTRLIKEKEG